MTAHVPLHILLNGLSVGGGGGYTVARGLWQSLAADRPDWTFSLLLTEAHPLHEQMRQEPAPPNARLAWAPPQTRGRFHRARYEGGPLRDWMRREGVGAVVQLNGMVPPGVGVPILAHFQDPLPYRPITWTSLYDRVLSLARRRAHRRALRTAAYCGWTSQYLRDLICDWQRIHPRGEVFYNGVPDDWIRRAREALPPYEGRALQIVSVSNVSPYKRQHLVIEALPLLLKMPGLAGLTYRVAGAEDVPYRQRMDQRVRELGLADRVFFEGRVDDARVRQLMAESSCFVLMSVCESFGLPAVEAMSFGTPVVTSDCCAMPEVCGDAADLSPVDDVPALASRIARVLTDRPHAEELRQHGAERVAHFGWAATAAKMARALEQIATRPQ